MITNSSLGIFFLLMISNIPSSFATAQQHTTAPPKHKHNAPQTIPKNVEKSIVSDPQITIYSAHKDKNNYVIALYTDRPGKALITYDSPTCQANSYGNTTINPKNKSEIEFTSTEDPLCKIALQKTNNNQLKITKETPACAAWHGDFCTFSSISLLTRIYPQ
ncbi:hypothetical protein [Commensalibacter nepenthis]|uniref:Uncharacterized protein n=1 Tax=Commensalibacter nepenthis TaxID=3043872 RepID=A0ABT6Q957_9PROT|nr:hypothetical protein [Commensalibacter sp. TBRC 10068]MDI2113287.1 hypothetical protein [Commensalibacter sp. TBRC 10068]